MRTHMPKMGKQLHMRAEKYAEMMAALKEAPYSADELHELIGIAASTARTYVQALHQSVPPVVFIDHYEKGLKYYIPHYRLKMFDYQKDALHPSNSVEQRRAKRAADRRRQRMAARAKLNEQAGMRVDGRALRHEHKDWRNEIVALQTT